MPASARLLRLVLLVLLALSVLPGGSGPGGSGSAAPGIPGQTATRLGDGRWLIVGGESGGRPLATAELRDPRTGAVTELALGQPRAWHTSTVLPDGRVLLLGGVGADGAAGGAPERFDPETGRFEPLGLPDLRDLRVRRRDPGQRDHRPSCPSPSGCR